ncbi:MAG: TIGR03118 family protein [Candidatus Binatia bacterium]
MDRDRQWRSSARVLWVVAAGVFLTFAVVVGCGNGDDDDSGGQGYRRTNLVYNVPGVAPVTDPNLLNAWGIAWLPGGPWWVANNGSGTSTVYDGDGDPFPPLPAPLVVAIPPPAGSPPGARGRPTGIVGNTTSDFVITQGAASGPAAFIFATEDGTIAGWNLLVNPTNAVLAVDNHASGAIYKGLAIGSSNGANFIYATNFHAGTVDVFDAHFQAVHTPGAFVDPDLPAGYAPFGIQALGTGAMQAIWVTYALQDASGEDDVPGPGNGFVSLFDPAGNFIERFASRGALDSPWGITQAPATFGRFAGKILIGNFGNGRINVFDPSTRRLRGQLNEPNSDTKIEIDGLWGIGFGNGGLAGSADVLYFAAGPNDEVDGLFGMIQPVFPQQ